MTNNEYLPLNIREYSLAANTRRIFVICEYSLFPENSRNNLNELVIFRCSESWILTSVHANFFYWKWILMAITGILSIFRIFTYCLRKSGFFPLVTSRISFRSHGFAVHRKNLLFKANIQVKWRISNIRHVGRIGRIANISRIFGAPLH